MTQPIDNPCLQEARRFVDLLYPCAPKDWLLVFVKSKGYPWTKWFRPDQRDAMLAYMVEMGQQYDTFVGIGTRRERIPRKRGGVEDITAIPGVWMDIDIHGEAHKNAKLPRTVEEALDLLSDFLKPSVIIHTGHGLHVYWLFEKLWTLQSDEARCHASRVLHGFQAALKERARQRG
jgi:putative DNA primase/helicase